MKKLGFLDPNKIIGLCDYCDEPVKRSEEDYTEDGELVHEQCAIDQEHQDREDKEFRDLMGH